ncbi:MAG: PLD nuclease N-terminal domain-containing protein, partial [Monoglobales bacterium]
MNKKWFRSLFRQRMIVCLLLFLQLLFLIFLLISGSATSAVIAGLFRFISIIVSLYIFSCKNKGAYKLTWVFLILMFPIFGGLFYLIFKFQSSPKKAAERLEKILKKSAWHLFLPESYLDEAKKELPFASSALHYMQNHAGFPVYSGSETEYLPIGEKMFEQMLSELE